MSEKSRQAAKNSVKKNFFKLLNNANSCYDCQNSFKNCTFEPIHEELNEISYIKKYCNFFDKSILPFIISSLIEVEIEKTFNKKILIVNNDVFTDSKIGF